MAEPPSVKGELKDVTTESPLITVRSRNGAEGAP
jgi:hypothetical protein